MENININSITDVDLEFLIQECFLGYKFRKANKKLYSGDMDLPRKLIYLYYSNCNNKNFDTMKKAFINHYVKNESELECIHELTEREGFKQMYEYAHENEELIDIYTILDYHKILYSTAPYPECAGIFRNYDVYLPGTGNDLCEWSMIRIKIKELSVEIDQILEFAKLIKENDNITLLFNYIEKCIRVKCALIQIHPFSDGNGRTIRCFLNKLFELADIPPVYICENERTEYHIAMNKANCENDLSYINNFYYFKICDSIIELDINNRMNKQVEKKNVKKYE